MSAPPGQGGHGVLVDARCWPSSEQVAEQLDGLRAGRRVAGVPGATWPVALLRRGGDKARLWQSSANGLGGVRALVEEG